MRTIRWGPTVTATISGSQTLRWALSVVAAIAVASPGPAGAQGAGNPGRTHAFVAGEFSSKEVCGACHKDIAEAWSQRSIHATTMNNPSFLTSLPEDEALRATCLSCHAPTTQLTHDTDMRLALTREGVTCDFCHSVEAVTPGALSPFTLDVGARKRGPLKNPGLPPHEVVVSDLHTKSEFCGGCHEYKNAAGVAVLSNYSEWKAGPLAARNVTCQGCHMEIYQAKVVYNQQSQEVSRTFINLHAVPGGRSKPQLQRAFDLGPVKATGKDGQVKVEVQVTNRGAGHYVPGGMPNRYVTLDVTVEGRPEPERQTRVYRRTLTDADGRVITDVPRMFTDAVRVSGDTRLAPQEARDERFLFRGAPKGSTVTARLVYVVEPPVEGADRREIEVLRVTGAVE
jgi:hypothetical protein